MQDFDVYEFAFERKAVQSFRTQVREMKYEEIVKPPFTLAVEIRDKRYHEHLEWVYFEVDKW